MSTVTLLGAQHPVTMPSIGIAEALLMAAVAAPPDTRGFWALSACLGVCCGQAFVPRGVSLVSSGMDVLRFGEAVYSHLRERGETTKAILEAARPLIPQLTARVAPVTEEEVTAQAGFSVAGAGG